MRNIMLYISIVDSFKKTYSLTQLFLGKTPKLAAFSALWDKLPLFSNFGLLLKRQKHAVHVFIHRSRLLLSQLFSALLLLGALPACAFTEQQNPLMTCFTVPENRRTEFHPLNSPDGDVEICHPNLSDYDGDGVPNVYDGNNGEHAGDYTQFASQNADDASYYEISSIYQLQAIQSLQCPPRVPAAIDRDGDGESDNLLETMMEGTVLKRPDGTTDILAVADCTGNMGDQSMRLGANYRLTANIDASITQEMNYDGDFDASTPPTGAGFQPIGIFVSGSPGSAFNGEFNGAGYIISNLTINRTSESNVGLIGRANSGNIRNVGLIDVNVTGDGNIGGLVGRGDIDISNSYVTGNVTGNGSSIGGLAGRCDGSISNSYAAVTVVSSSTGSISTGGLVGSSATISNSYATGTVTGVTDVGGLVGSFGSGTISNSYATGTVTGNATIGGLVGYINGGMVISNSYTTGTVTGGSNIGGLVGNFSSGTVSGVNYFVTNLGVNGIGTGTACLNTVCILEMDSSFSTIFGALFNTASTMAPLGMGWATTDWTDRGNAHPCIATIDFGRGGCPP